jgi:glycosyltransferase involved in cell wall biosynthesis
VLAEPDSGEVYSANRKEPAPMLIMLVTDVTVRGGVDGHVIQLAEALRRSRHSPVLVLEETTTSALREAFPATGDLPVRYSALYRRRHSPERLQAAASAILDRFRPDGVHIICGSPRSCLTLRNEVLLRGIPLVITEQQVDDRLVVTPEERRRIRSSYRSARRVVFVSEGNRATMDRLVGLDGVSTELIANGVAVAAIRARAEGIVRPPASRGARIMTAARLAREKGLDVLIRAVATLPSGLVREVNIFGDGPKRPVLERLVADLDEAGRVTLHPWVSDIPELMAYHHLFVLASTAEGLPFAVLEAMSVGIPVVATDVPGSAEALAHGEAGILVPQRDVVALASAITARLRDPIGTAALAEAALQRVRTHYELSVQMRRTVGLWEGP